MADQVAAIGEAEAFFLSGLGVWVFPLKLGGELPAGDVQNGGNELGNINAVAGAGLEQASGAVDGDGESLIGFAFDVGHQAKKLKVFEHQLVFAGIVAVQVEGDVASLVEDALYLGEVVAVQEGFWGRRVEAGENAVFFEVGVESLFNVDGFHGAI